MVAGKDAVGGLWVRQEEPQSHSPREGCK
jgi:hypothetical protein